MELYSEALDPSETKDYAWDWSPKLADGESVFSHTVAFISAAGTTSPSNSVTDNLSRVFLTGGNPGGRVIYTILATTNQGRTFDVALAVDVVENSTKSAGDSEVDRIRAEISAAKTMRAKISSGEAIMELWRDGRHVRKVVPTLSELNNHIRSLEQELEGALAAESGKPRRRAISIAYRN